MTKKRGGNDTAPGFKRAETKRVASNPAVHPRAMPIPPSRGIFPEWIFLPPVLSNRPRLLANWMIYGNMSDDTTKETKAQIAPVIVFSLFLKNLS
jgi:hypothetical protein